MNDIEQAQRKSRRDEMFRYLEDIRLQIAVYQRDIAREEVSSNQRQIVERELADLLGVMKVGIQLMAEPDPDPDLLPFYNSRKFALAVARENSGKEIADMPGDFLAAYTDGSLEKCFVRFDSPVNDPICLDEFNPIRVNFSQIAITTLFIILLPYRECG